MYNKNYEEKTDGQFYVIYGTKSDNEILNSQASIDIMDDINAKKSKRKKRAIIVSTTLVLVLSTVVGIAYCFSNKKLQFKN